MLRTIVATGIAFVGGYVLGVTFGFRAAVVDYVERDAKKIENIAASLYPSVEEGAQGMPDVVREALEEAEDESDDDGRTAFH